MLLSWVVFPLVFLALCMGCGLLVRHLAGGPDALRPGLVVPVGLATVITLTNLATTTDATTPLGLWVTLAVSAAGFLVARRTLRASFPEPWLLGAAFCVVLAYGAPVLASGDPTFTGYIKLDDSATWFALADQALPYGRDISRVAPSSFSRTLESYLSTGYPLGSFLPLGVGHALTGGDVAWLSVPFMALMGGMLALCLGDLLRGVVPEARRRAAVAFIAAQPALLYGYVHWGGIKEMAAAALVALVAALVPTLGGTLRGTVPLAVALVGLMGVLSLGGGAWAAPVILAGVVAGRSWRTASRLPLVGLLTVLLALPAVTLFGTFNTTAKVVLRSSAELGNLIGPLRTRQALGIWPASDFRLAPQDDVLTSVMLVVLLAAAAAGLVLAWRRREDALFAYGVGAPLAFLVFLERGSPWLDGKAMATVGPVALTAGLGALALGTMHRRSVVQIGAAAGFLLLAGGVLWSNALSYRAAYLAPHERLVELEDAGDRVRGEGPTLMTDYEPVGVRHFLREADAEGASELRVRQIPLRDGSLLAKSAQADIGAFAPAAVQEYRTLVLRRSPLASRPPADYRLLHRGTHYDIWQRPATAVTPPVADLPLGGPADPGAVPACDAVQALAAQTPQGGRLLAVPRTVPVTASLTELALPAGWVPDAPGTVLPRTSGRQEFTVSVPVAGRYDVWLGGSSRGRTEVELDGRRVGDAVRHTLNNQGGGIPFGTVELAAGTHRVAIDHDLSGPAPGVAGADVTPLPLGPLVLGPADDARKLLSVAPADFRELCGRRLDWVAIGPGKG